MSNELSIVAGIAGRYATALFDLGQDSGNLDKIAGDIADLGKILDESAELRSVISSPLISRDEQGAAVQAIAERAGFDDLTRKFLGLVSSKKRLFALPGIVRAFRALMARHRGEISADVVSARPLTDAQKTALAAELKTAMGQDVTIEDRVDADLMGGLVVKVGSVMVDSSIRTRLQNLELAMKEVG